MTEGAMNTILDSIADRVANRVVTLLLDAKNRTAAQVGANAATPAAAAPPAPASEPADDEAVCDTCFGSMTWKDPKPGSKYPGRYWCNAYGCKGKAR
jgi:hypothetical protein